jgi:plasmid stabilization system protein ParE
MADHYRVILSPQALGALERIFEYISRDSVENAARMVDEIYTECESLDRFPHRYPVDRRGKSLPFEVRLMPVPPYRVLYRIMEEQSAVRILTIRHGRQKQWP